MRFTFNGSWKVLALAAALALSACGGDDGNPLGITKVKVMGDSLNDSGTFAGTPGVTRTFTVQGSSNEPYVLWVERVARAYDLAALCPVYRFNGTTFVANTQQSGCTNYAIGGGRINNALGTGGSDAPLSILRQLRDAGQAGFTGTDVVLVDGGGNDAADLVGAYLGARTNLAAYSALLSTLLPAATVQTVLAGAQGPETAGALYMQALADSFADGLRTNVLGKGAKQLVVANMPTITYTPRFQAVLDQIAAASGGGTTGATARAQAEALFRAWIDAYNQRLSAQLSGDARVKVADVAGRFNDFIARPQSYGLTNVTLPVCGADGVTVVPKRDFSQCTAAALSATPPPPGAPTGTDWWQRFLFADGFHPTPYGHELMGTQVTDILRNAGWL